MRPWQEEACCLGSSNGQSVWKGGEPKDVCSEWLVRVLEEHGGRGRGNSRLGVHITKEKHAVKVVWVVLLGVLILGAVGGYRSTLEPTPQIEKSTQAPLVTEVKQGAVTENLNDELAGGGLARESITPGDEELAASQQRELPPVSDPWRENSPFLPRGEGKIEPVDIGEGGQERGDDTTVQSLDVPKVIPISEAARYYIPAEQRRPGRLGGPPPPPPAASPAGAGQGGAEGDTTAGPAPAQGLAPPVAPR